ncbi:GNAT family N-acetyltransferase [Burkholderia cepacia]|uniref:GNAT family N-acetyltransferase n=2 Tax=Burkholderia cepacia TaxID=292 RepID=UPI001ABAFC98|nr:GNAT family N-acetyltransferase [Burkholderia cepacia]UIY59766.1 GNAT family N-acetyltransferase [Burkholderia cepacia]
MPTAQAEQNITLAVLVNIASTPLGAASIDCELLHKPTEDEMIRWTRIDRRREGAVIATITHDGRERLIGMARYTMDDGETDVVECAIVIDDAWQRQGLGRVLLSSLIDLAGRSDMKRIVGTTLSENVAVIGLARSLGFGLSREPGAAFVTDLTFDLDTRRSEVTSEA